MVDARNEFGRNEHMTFKANMGVGRHGWLRLTPAYGVRIVRERIEALRENSLVFDPFSGTGTTALAAAELGHVGRSADVNPFLVWLGNAKMSNYSQESLQETIRATHDITAAALKMGRVEELWQPNLFKIEKWWSDGSLHALKALRHEIDKLEGAPRNLLDVAFCRTLITCSNAAFNHQSMSFKDTKEDSALFDLDDFNIVLESFAANLQENIDSAEFDLQGEAKVLLGDSRGVQEAVSDVDAVITSPPYVNRMSYIRELRPYMYWMRYLNKASDAGDLDWEAIGGTWGTATSKVGHWTPESSTPIDEEMNAVCERIAADGKKNGPLLANYVSKYHHDMWEHFQSITGLVRKGGTLSYIIGNSTFYGHEVPAHKWYADMLKALGYEDVQVTTIRKRNSNKKLFEYDVSATRT